MWIQNSHLNRDEKALEVSQEQLRLHKETASEHFCH